MKILFLIACFIFATGCGSGHRGFMRDGATEQEFYSELQECTQQVTPQLKLCAGSGCVLQNIEIRNQRNLCMQAKGWRITKEEGRFIP